MELIKSVNGWDLKFSFRLIVFSMNCILCFVKTGEYGTLRRQNQGEDQDEIHTIARKEMNSDA